jgi:hypothetical protein
MQPRGQARTAHHCTALHARTLHQAITHTAGVAPAIKRMRCHTLACIRPHCGHQAHVLRHIRHPPSRTGTCAHVFSVLARASAIACISCSDVRSALTRAP